MGDAWGVSISCSMDVSNVGRIMKSIYCDTLLGGVMALISPLLDGSCFKMLTLDNNLENEKKNSWVISWEFEKVMLVFFFI